MNLKTQMEKVIGSSYTNIGGIVVLKEGQKLYENYYNGCTMDTALHIFSATKSIVSILIGIALDKGYLQSVEQKVLDFFPDYVVKSGEKTLQQIIIRDLLTMTAPYKFKSEPYKTFFASEDWVKSTLDLLGGKGKIGEFRYAPIIGPDIFTSILAKVTGQSVLDFATEHLFTPLGITTVKSGIVFQNEEEQLAFYKEKDVRGWVSDPKGISTGGWGLSLTPCDMAKIGQVYLDGGKWEGKQIVFSQWVSESTKKQSLCNEFKLAYGYLWWLIDEREGSFAAMGDGGNVIYVNPKKRMVIAIGSLFMPKAKDRVQLIKKYIEPAFENQ